MRKYYSDPPRPAQPPSVIKAGEFDLDVLPAVRRQWQYDREWFEEKDERRLRVRPLIEPERVEYQLPRSPEWKGVSVIAQCGDCRCRYVRHIIGQAAHVEPRLNMGDDELLASLDELTSRFFRFISEPSGKIFRCGRCGSSGG